VVCLVVTRAGWGDVWSHESRTHAWLHPLTQYGDAILDGPESIISEYGAYEWAAAADLAQVTLPELDLQILRQGAVRECRAVMARTAGLLWDALLDAASPALTDPSRVCEQVSRDRRNTTMAKKEAAPKVHAEKPAGEKKSAGPRGTATDATIHMLFDKSGKQYGADNNPKKVGSKGHERFAQYVDGMTVEAALKAGVWAADVSWDVSKGFIELRGGTPKAEKAPKAPKTEAAEAAAAE